jgi:hypothetical protein
VAAARFKEGAHRAEIEFAALVHERPPDAFAGGEKAGLAEAAIIAVDLPVVFGRDDLVDPVAMLIGRGRAFEAGEEEALEKRVTA